MASLYPGAIDTFTDPSGTSLLATGPDHAADHTLIHSSTKALENTIGTTLGTALFGAYGAADKPLRHQGGTVQQVMFGTLNNGVLGTPNIQGGTLGTATIKTPIASGIYSNGNITGNATITWTNGDRQCGTMTGNGTLIFAGTATGQIITLVIYQDITGGRTLAFPTMKWPGTAAGTIGTAASSIHTLTVMCDQNSNYLAQLNTNYG